MVSKNGRHDLEYVNVEQEDNILIVQLARPEKRNALSDDLFLELEVAFTNIPDGVGAIILAGEGQHFSAGLDLSELRERDALEGVHHSRMWHRILDRIQFCPVPVIAKLHGAVVGGGLEIATAAHIRIAERSTFFALPEGTRGVFVGGGASVNVMQLIGKGRMMDMMLTGRVVTAEEGERLGLAQYLVDDGEGMAKAMELAKKVAGNAPATNYGIINVLPRIAELGQDQGMLMESLIAGIVQSAPEAKQRIRDFLEKRAKKVGE